MQKTHGHKKRERERHGHFSHWANRQEDKQFENNMNEHFISQLKITKIPPRNLCLSQGLRDE